MQVLRSSREKLDPGQTARVAAAVTLGGTLAILVLQWVYVVAPLLHARPAVWQDSLDYIRLSHVHLPALLTRSRPPLYPFLVHILGHGTTMLVAQGVVSAIAFDLLAVAVFVRARRGWFRYFAAAFIACFPLTQSISLWNYSILTESFTLAANALAVAAWVWFRRSWLLGPALAIAALAGALLRDSEVMLFLLLGLALVAFGFYDRPNRRKQWAAAACLLAVSLSALALASSTKRTSVYLKDVFYVRIFPYPNRVAWFASHGMPDAKSIDVLATNTTAQAGFAKVVSYNLTDPAYANLNAWFRDSAEHAYLLYLATHPLYVITEPLQHPTQSFNSVGDNVRGYAPKGQSYPVPIDDIVFAPGWLLTIAALVAAALLLTDEFAEEPLVVQGALLVAAGLVLTLIVWHGEGQEIARHNLESDVIARLGVILALAGVGVTADPGFMPGEDDG